VIRLLVATPVALFCALALFSFMAYMVDTRQRPEPEQTQALSFNMVMTENEQQLQRRKRSVPEQPETPQVPEQTPVSRVNSQQTQLSPLSQPALGLNTAIDGIAISAPEFGDFGVNQEIVPLYRVKPNYPPRAKKRGIEGYVVMRFTIDPTGKPVDIEVVESKPKRIFDRDAIRALAKWKYQPKTEQGRSVAQYGEMIKLEFELEK